MNFKGFNSTMVRLKLPTLFRRVGCPRFQFHYGSIKIERGRRNRISLIGFNSTMVRLKWSRELGKSARSMSFNSTMVRLKYYRLGKHFPGFGCFNSTMVRLKYGKHEYQKLGMCCFNSTMVRLKFHSVDNFGAGNNVSIPLWFD